MKKGDRALLLLAGLAGIGVAAAAAYAAETITYTYDARGRLVKAERAGSVNNNVSASYTYDKADNRTNVNVVSPNPP
jgi:uncharacterized protein involved in exopolysaccharide biosynthesis